MDDPVLIIPECEDIGEALTVMFSPHVRQWLAGQASARPAYLPEVDWFSFASGFWRNIDAGLA
ncbi:MAG: hypothetical protein ACK6DZ_25765 [Acidobacteriota bacterium]